jgi:hypothetical protein
VAQRFDAEKGHAREVTDAQERAHVTKHERSPWGRVKSG